MDQPSASATTNDEWNSCICQISTQLPGKLTTSTSNLTTADVIQHQEEVANKYGTFLAGQPQKLGNK